MLRFVDTNKELVTKVEELFKKYNYNSQFFGELKAIHGDVFEEKEKNGGRICTASNPSFNMEGGLDLAISQKYKVENPKEFSWSNNLFYIITVNDNYKSSKKIIQRALCGVFSYRRLNLILTGIGTGIGGLSNDEFIEELEDIILANMYGADMSGANMSYADMRGADMRGADIREADMRGANMSGADMRGVDMRGADMSGADMYVANMRGADMRGANMSGADMGGADMNGANMREADMSGADMCGANMRGADMYVANMRGADMRGANMSGADMGGADMSGVDMSGANVSANLSEAKGIPDMSEWFNNNFEKNSKGYIVYKAIGNTSYELNPNWKIKRGEYLTENVNLNPTFECGCGVNFATLDYINKNYKNADSIWECLIEFKDLISTVIPYNTDGKGRCARLKLIKKIK